MHLHYVQHVWFEDLGIINNWAEEKGITVTRTALHLHETLPHVNNIDCLVIMGGPMSVYDEKGYPWLKYEKTFIENAIKNGTIVLGICLGAQLIADVLGARVYRNTKREIGWFPVRILNSTSSLFTEITGECIPFHWHEDTFDIPDRAIRCAESSACPNQVFSYDNDRVIGLQFHLEITQNGIQRLIAECGNELTNEQYVQSPQEILHNVAYIESANKHMITVLEKLIKQRRTV